MQATWQPVVATITSCRRTWDTWFTDEATPEEGGLYTLAEFLVTCQYQVEGKTYTGRYKAGAPHTPGETLNILYDPRNPADNTGLDPTPRLFTKLVVWSVGILFLILLIKLFPEAFE